MSRTYYKRESWADKDETIGEVRGSCYQSAKPADAEWFEHNACIYGDYVGGGVYGRSNLEVIAEEYADLEDKAWFACSCGYGARFLRFHIGVENAKPGTRWGALREALDGLDDYPLLDEDHCSYLESEEESEAWESYGANDFASELAKLAPHHGQDFFLALGSGYLGKVWRAIAEEHRGGESVIHEQGGAYFPFYQTFDRGGAGKPTWEEVRKIILWVAAERACRGAA